MLTCQAYDDDDGDDDNFHTTLQPVITGWFTNALGCKYWKKHLSVYQPACALRPFGLMILKTNYITEDLTPDSADETSSFPLVVKSL